MWFMLITVKISVNNIAESSSIIALTAYPWGRGGAGRVDGGDTHESLLEAI